MGKAYVKFKLVKSLSIAMLGIYYFIGGIIVSETIEYILPKYVEEKYKKMDTYKLILELLLSTSIIVICVYFLRILIKKISYIFENIEGFKVLKLSEINGTVILAYALFFNMTNLNYKLEELSKRIDLFIYNKEKSSVKWGI